MPYDLDLTASDVERLLPYLEYFQNPGSVFTMTLMDIDVKARKSEVFVKRWMMLASSWYLTGANG